MKEFIIKVDDPDERVWDGSPKVFETRELIRCKECKHRSKELYDYCGNPKDKRYVCEINDVAKKPDWFCGDGERGEPEWPASTFVPLGQYR